MAPVAALGEEKVDSVLDLCAAPGGKSLQAARSLLKEGGILVCNEPNALRRRVLMQNLERCGQMASVTALDACELPSDWTGRFSLVLCDAPCSGEGMMRKNEDSVALWSQRTVLECAALQEKILESAARVCGAGGTVLYSTCTWSLEENEAQIARFLAAHEEFTLAEAKDSVRQFAVPGSSVAGFDIDLRAACRFYPHRFRGEGQFFAILKKAGSPSVGKEAKEKKEKKKRNGGSPKEGAEEKLVRDFLQSVLISLPSERIRVQRESVYLVLPDMPQTEETVSPGVLVGEIRKGRIAPHHRFFLAYAPLFSRKIHLTLEEAMQYLAGAELPCDERDGWAVALWGDCPLGGVKISGGVAKNHYPKGLRKGL